MPSTTTLCCNILPPVCALQTTLHSMWNSRKPQTSTCNRLRMLLGRAPEAVLLVLQSRPAPNSAGRCRYQILIARLKRHPTSGFQASTCAMQSKDFSTNATRLALSGSMHGSTNNVQSATRGATTARPGKPHSRPCRFPTNPNVPRSPASSALARHGPCQLLPGPPRPPLQQAAAAQGTS